MAPLDAERLRRNIVLYATLAMAAISLVVATVAIAPLALRLRENALLTLRHDLGLKVMAAAEVVTRAGNLAQQVTSRTVIRERLEAYNRGEVTLTGLADFTRDKLADALNLSPELVGIARFAPGGELVVSVGTTLDQSVAPPLGGRTMTMALTAAEDATPLLLVAAPIIGKGGILAGTDVVLVNAGSLKAIVDDARALGRTSEAALIDAHDPPRVLIDSGPRGGADAISAQGREGAAVRLAVERGASVLDQDGDLVLTAEALPASPWVLLLRMRATEATAAVDRLLLLVMLGAAGLIALGGFGLRRMLRPLTGVLIVHHTEMARQPNWSRPRPNWRPRPARWPSPTRNCRNTPMPPRTTCRSRCAPSSASPNC